MSRRTAGIVLAVLTASVSGVAVWVNSHAVTRFGDATVYTTAKNAVAGVVLLALALPLFVAPRGRTFPTRRRGWLALVAIAAIGGSIPFVLFFEGLARAEATQAAFIHKTLVVWVALIAVPLLRERLGQVHLAAIALLIAGQIWLVGELGTVAFGAGEAMILAATLLWAVEVILAKRLLDSIPVRTLAVARMGIGTLLLVGWLAISGRGDDLLALSAEQWSWAILTGLLLSAYVATWYVFGAVVTAALARTTDGVTFDVVGVLLVTIGAALAAIAGRRDRVRTA